MKTTSRSSRHPLASRWMQAYVWLMVGAVCLVQARGVVRTCISTGQLCDFGRFYYATLAWRGGGDLYAPNPATPAKIRDTTLHMPNVASPAWHAAVLPFTYLSPVTA